MRRFLFPLLLLLATVLRAQEYDVLVYGATPSGIAAAIAAARDGERVLLVEPSRRIGGMMTNGLSHTDIRTLEGMNGAYLDFARRVVAYYTATYGADSPQVRDSFHGIQFEPKIALATFEKMLAEQPKIVVQKEWYLDGTKSSSNGDGEGPATSKAVEIALFFDGDGAYHSVAAHYFIDATYEGDLAGCARAAYRVGREAGSEFGESLAPDEADDQLQAFNFRLSMTKNPANRVPVAEPPGYLRDEFVDLLALLLDGRIHGVFSMKPTELIKAQGPLPNDKYDINDMSKGLVRLSLPGENDGWPEGESGFAARVVQHGAIAPFSRTGLRQSRDRVFDEHLRWDVGLIYFLQNDEAVPPKFREEAREWGWCKDEFLESSHLPMELYVREGRRVTGEYVFTEKDTDCAPDDARTVLHKDAIAMGDYGPNCHGTSHQGSRFGGHHTGEFYKTVAPYQIPFGVLVPKGFENLLVTCAVSSSHVGYCALRLEPIWMSLGEAAGHAAHLARRKHGILQTVSIPKIQELLHAEGGATIYVSDVLPGSPDFAVVQWWGTAGGLHGLAPTPAKPGQRGQNLFSQYYETFPGHAAELDKPLDTDLATRWQKLAGDLGVDAALLPKADGKTTRGAWLRAAWAGRPS
ncbi:MAG: FAD-dependent oxidoreductase [Chthoniobacter sp.]|uniref:FAD-dependent oxidoreductase n=1 Tax=Chthoniobacter sp. TaxID=2510640 RepID=UPI0032A4396C